MKWVKIEEGGEMPEIFEVVLICGGSSDTPWWTHGSYRGGVQFYALFDEARYEATHWARVELPGEVP